MTRVNTGSTLEFRGRWRNQLTPLARGTQASRHAPPFRPGDTNPLAFDPLESGPDPDEQRKGSLGSAARRLIAFTALLRLLIGADVLTGLWGLPDFRPLDASLSMIVAILGAMAFV